MNYSSNKIEQAKSIIINAAKKKGRVWYSELYLAIGLNHTNPGDRQEGAHILGTISRESNEQNGVMLSAVVNGKTEGDPADGFYELAQELGRLSSTANEDEKLKFWVEEFKRCHKFCTGERAIKNF